MARNASTSLGAEVGWEIGEDIDAVIESYRESSISLNYHGDSIANSMADVLAFTLGADAGVPDRGAQDLADERLTPSPCARARMKAAISSTARSA